MPANNYELIMNWVREKANELCYKCEDTCCNAQKHGIDIKESELEIFANKGIPIYSRDKLKKSAKWFTLTNGQTLFDINEQPLVKPSIVQIGKDFVIYSERFCPMYNNQTKECQIHNQTLKPETCKQYPLEFKGLNGIEKFWSIRESCKPFDSKEIRDDFNKHFGQYSIYLVKTPG